MAEIRRIAVKEFGLFFASPAAFLFLGAFLAAVQFHFFWGEAIFSRNIADVRPLFQGMPLILIFLVAALTMRSWAEERRSGTLELLLTSPVSPFSLIWGKFLATLSLVALALSLTLPLPFTIAVLGPLDWGPVVGGYLAALFLAAAYISIGLAMSARSDNAIVAMILTAAVSGGFYLIGAEVLTRLFGYTWGGYLRLLGSGSRFESITRGVVDFRDLFYYMALVGLFLILNRLTLERIRQGGGRPLAGRLGLRWLGIPLPLWGVILVGGSAVLEVLGGTLRVDITAGRIHSLSPVTARLVSSLEEPLLIRGYFSVNTHPQLAPLIPRIRDLMSEYGVLGQGRVQVEFVDPESDPVREQEATNRYGIRPVPFQMASRYQSAVVNSYFTILVADGDEFERIGYESLIEVKSRGEEAEAEVLLHNPEYAITQAIRKVMSARRAQGDPLEKLSGPVTVRVYLSGAERLPKEMAPVPEMLSEALREVGSRAGERWRVEVIDPDAAGGEVAGQLRQLYGFRPQILSPAEPNPFWFRILLEGEGLVRPVPIPPQLSRESLIKSLEVGLRQLAPGYLKTVILSRPRETFFPGERLYSHLRGRLGESFRVREDTLESGRVPADADLLLVLGPISWSDRQRFALDQFLMQGRTVVLATSPFDVTVNREIAAKKLESGLEGWLGHHGLAVSPEMILDPQNTPLSVPVKRQVGTVEVQELHRVPYPFFPDLGEGGLDAAHPVTASLAQLTLAWASPLLVDPDKNRERAVTGLLTTSVESWSWAEPVVVPDTARFPKLGFPEPEKRQAFPVGVLVEGRFDSFYGEGGAPVPETEPPSTAAFRSPPTARLILLGATGFASDQTMILASDGMGTIYSRPVEFLQNVADWALDDEGLLAIRGRAGFARTLRPLDHSRQLFWEYLNYGLAIVGLAGVWMWRRRVRLVTARHHRLVLAGSGGD
ncbi:MAG: Gldg family protein [Magnetococcales bacterium]|nr:Gldg family protein [Magnetococcales bacterium]